MSETQRRILVEVEATHLGLGFSPRVFEIIAKRLARRESGERKRA